MTLTNSGSAALAISWIGLTGANAGDYAQTNTCPLSPARSRSAPAARSRPPSPERSGARTAAISVADDAPGSPQTVALSGTGTAPAVGLTPSSVAFGNQLIGTTSPAQDATLTNTGSAPLTISSIGLTGTNAADYAQTNTCPLGPSTLAASASCTISITFTPGAGGSRTASVSVADDAPGGPHRSR